MKGGDGIRVMVSGLGAITSIGNSVPEVLDSLRTEKSGIKIHPELGRLDVPVKLAGVIEGFEFPSHHSHTWKWPGSTPISREALRSLPPHGVYAWLALVEAIRQADLTPEDLSNGRTGLLTASAGSSWLQHENMRKFLEAGPGRSSPFGLVSSIAGTLTFNLAAAFEIRGVCGGVSSACASSAQALGYAWDQIVFGRADRIIVIGAEDCDSHTILPFAAFRAVTTGTDPNASPCAFDEARDGFAATGGAAVVILESDAALRKRGREGFAELRGWGCAGDGHHPMAPEPDGTGILQSMQSALRSAQMETEDIDYLNAHAPLTPSGDAAEARAIDQASPRKNAPLVTINCAALPANLIESECFGHERGAFTGATTRREGRFAQADGGTIFLDEIGELPLELQAKLLRVLQEGTFEPLGGSRTIKVDVRVIAATHRDLSKMVAQGSFREDLYFRLNVFPIHVPPLRERSSDIEFLAREFCEELGRRMGRRLQPPDATQLAVLREHSWPGNVRELRNVIERAIILAENDRPSIERAMVGQGRSSVPGKTPEAVLTNRELLELERKNMERALEICQGRISGPKGAAQLLGIPPSTLSSRMKTLGIRSSR